MNKREQSDDGRRDQVEREVRWMLEHVAGADAEKLLANLRRVADLETIRGYLRDMELPRQSEICVDLARTMTSGIGSRDEHMRDLSDMMAAYGSGDENRMVLDSLIGGLVKDLRETLTGGPCVETLVQRGKSVVIRGGALIEIPWTGTITCDFCTRRMESGEPIWICAVILKWHAAEGKVEDEGGYGICRECRTCVLGRERMTFPDYVLLVSRKDAPAAGAGAGPDE